MRTSPFPHTGVKINLVSKVLESEDRPFTCKEIGTFYGWDTGQERVLKAISNACSYLRAQGVAIRTAGGTYQQRGNRPPERRRTPVTINDLGALPTNNGTHATASTVSEERFECPECGGSYKSQMGLRAHITRAHGKPMSPDEMFERTGRALEILFPDGIPASRVIEIADLQKAMLRAIK